MKPREISDFLQEDVIGQAEALRFVSVAIFKHFQGEPYGNLLLLGNSGTGARLILSLLAAVPGEVVVDVAGCGICHTDLGFFYDWLILDVRVGDEVDGADGEGEGGGGAGAREALAQRHRFIHFVFQVL